MNCRYSGSLFYCKVADLFNHCSKYVCDSFHWRSSSWGFICYCFSTYCYLEVRKKHLCFFLSTAIRPNGGQSGGSSSSSSTGESLLEACDGGACRGELVPTAPCWPRAQDPCSAGLGLVHRTFRLPLCPSRRPDLRTKRGPSGVGVSSPRTPWAQGGSASCGEVRGGWGRGLPSCTLCPLAARLFKAEGKGTEAGLPSHGWYLLLNGSSVSRAEPNSELQC